MIIKKQHYCIFLVVIFVSLILLFLGKLQLNEANKDKFSIDYIDGKLDYYIKKHLNSSLRKLNDSENIQKIVNLSKRLYIKEEELIERALSNETKIEAFNIVPIAFSLDNNYLFPTLVSMTSMIFTKENNTFYEIFILISEEFNEENEEFLTDFCLYFYKECNMTLINTAQLFYDFGTTNENIPLSTYYRYILPELIQKHNKIIYLDGDTLVLKDLTNMFNQNVDDGIYFIGVPDYISDELDQFNIKTNTYINAGVLLMNLDSLRRSNFFQNFSNFVKAFPMSLTHHDQTAMNVLAVKHIEILRPKYGIFSFINEEEAEEYNAKLRSPYDSNEIKCAFNNPTIIHYAGEIKPWKQDSSSINSIIWYLFAEKCLFYEVFTN